MSLRWDATNLERHAAKHFLGNEQERWRDLLDPVGQHAWDRCRHAADAAGCRFDRHPEACPSLGCAEAHREAGGPYGDLVRDEWRFAERRAFLVRLTAEDGAGNLCATGPRGIVVYAVQLDEGERVAKTGFRVGGRRPVLDAVRRMRSHASPAQGAWTVNDFVKLETCLLRPSAPAEPKYRTLADDLLSGGAGVP